MENRIILSFDKSITRLAGYDYGKRTYLNQVKDKIDFSKVIYIEFPEEITRIASSFVQGFFEEIVSVVGVLGIGSKLIIECNEELKKSIISNL